MWGGRFAAGPAAVMREINASLPFDKRLWKQDIARLHRPCRHARRATASSARPMPRTIIAGLEEIDGEYAAGDLPSDLALEDIHMATESRLAEKIGPVAGRLHTARSRNDQVATDFRLWVRDADRRGECRTQAACSAPCSPRAAEHADAVMPGFTHLQSAQPVTLGHHLMAYHEMIARDRSRLRRCPGADESCRRWASPRSPAPASPSTGR